MNHWKFILTMAAWMVVMGCAYHRTTVVLMPDRNGQVGRAEILTERGRCLLETAGQATTVKGRKSPPSKIRVLKENQVQSMFAEAIAAEPPPPRKFTLYFTHDSTQLVKKSKDLFPKIIQSIQERNSYGVSVNGHTDRLGYKAYNLNLSLKRAQRVQNLLVKAGINPNYLVTSWHGEGNPLIQTRDGVAEPRNRRVEIIVR